MQIKIRIPEELWSEFLKHTNSPSATIRKLIIEFNKSQEDNKNEVTQES